MISTVLTTPETLGKEDLSGTYGSQTVPRLLESVSRFIGSIMKETKDHTGNGIGRPGPGISTSHLHLLQIRRRIVYK